MKNIRWWHFIDLIVWTCAIVVFAGLFEDLRTRAWEQPGYDNHLLFRMRFLVLYLFLFNAALQLLWRVVARRLRRQIGAASSDSRAASM
jgi:hypothetical protein